MKKEKRREEFGGKYNRRELNSTLFYNTTIQHTGIVHQHERSTRKMGGGEFGPGRRFSLHGNPRAMLLAFPGVVARSSYPLSIEYYTVYEWRTENRKRSLNNV